MPALLIPVITSALATTALSSTAIAATAFLAANAIVAGAALGLSALLSPGDDQKVASQQYQSRQAMPTLLYGYGTTKLGGSKFAFDAANGYYVDGIVHCCGPVSRVEYYMLNDVNVGLGQTPYGNGGVGGRVLPLPWDGLISLEGHLGTPGQGPALGLLSVLGGTFTAQHRLAGLFNTVMVCSPCEEKDFQRYYPNGPPAVYVVASLAPCYDPRNGAQDRNNPATWTWSANVGVAILHYLTAMRAVDSVTGKPVPYGFGFSYDRIDLQSFIDYANVCDQPVAKKDGTVEARYTISGTYDMGQEERRTVLNRLLATGDAEIYQAANGKIAIRGGQWTEPTVTITDEHILGYEYEGGADKLAAFNRLKISFIDPRNDYQIIEGDPWDDLTVQALIGEVTVQDLSLPMVPSHSQARRLAKIAMAKANPPHKLTLSTDLVGLLALGERTIRVVLDELGINDTFLVTSFTEATDGTCKIGVSSLSAAAYNWDAGLEEGATPAVASNVTQPVVIPDIQNPILQVDRVVSNGVVTSLGIRVTVNAPSVTTFILHGRIRVVGSGEGGWSDMVDVSNLWSRSYTTATDGANYEVQVAWWAPYGGTRGPWVGAGTIVATGDTTAPAVPTYNSATLSGTTVTHNVKQSGGNARSLRLSRALGFGNTFANAALSVSQAVDPNQQTTFTDSVSLGYITWWLVAVNSSGVASGPSAPLSLLNVTQPGNLTQFPNDQTNAVWARTGMGTPVAQGTGPDGAQATFVPESATTGGHVISYKASGLTSGGKIRSVWGLKAAGRSAGRIDLVDGNNSNAYARLFFDLTAGTVTMSTNQGSIFTATSISIVKVSADFWIVIFQATAATTSVDSRLVFSSTTTNVSYAGDTTKGMLTWACSLAVVT